MRVRVRAADLGERADRRVRHRDRGSSIKTAANAYLAMKISFINAMAQMCEAAGGDVVLLADALGYDSRIGREFLNAASASEAVAYPRTSRPSRTVLASWVYLSSPSSSRPSSTSTRRSVTR